MVDPNLVKELEVSIRTITQEGKQIHAHPIFCHLGLQPRRERARRLDEQELAIAVCHLDPNIFVALRQLAEDIYDHPLVFDRISVVGASVERGDPYISRSAPDWEDADKLCP